jgi:hypothetical protein
MIRQGFPEDQNRPFKKTSKTPVSWLKNRRGGRSRGSFLGSGIG